MNISKAIALITLLVLFISQSLAYAAMPCLHMGLGASMNDHNMMHAVPIAKTTTQQDPHRDHSLHARFNTANTETNFVDAPAKATKGTTSSMKMDCCDEDCNCPPGACANYALSRLNLPPFQSTPAPFTSMYRFSMNESDPVLLKRPPITA